MSGGTEKWYRRFADVPDIGYQGSPGVDRTRLPGHNVVPEISYYNFEGKHRVSMMWPMKDGSTSASPANTWETKPSKGEIHAETLLRNLHEKLELPGTLSDYHFAIQHCHGELGQHAREAFWIYEEIERLCWLDITLIEKYPVTITDEYGGERTYYGVTAFHKLIDMYEKEGYIREALKVAQIAKRFEQDTGKVEELRERIASVEAEKDAV